MIRHQFLIKSVFLVAALLAGCKFSQQERAIDKARAAVSEKDFRSALKHYRIAMENEKNKALSDEAVREAAKIADFQIKDYDQAIELYKKIILESRSVPDRIAAQRRLSEIYFGPKSDYVQAIIEFHRLLEMPLKHDDEVAARVSLARSYYYREDYFQGHVEVDQLLKLELSDKERFEALVLKATIYSTAKEFDPAIKILTELMSKYPQLAKEQAIGLVLAMTYEGSQELGRAIEVLQSMRDYYPNVGYLDSRVRALKERQSLMPGARGLKK